MKRFLFIVFLMALLCTACTAQQEVLSGESNEAPPQSRSEQVLEETLSSSGGEEQPVEYDGDGSDLITAKQLSTGKIVLITIDGDIVAEIPDNATNIGEGMIFIPGKGVVNYQGDLVFELDCEWMYGFSEGLAPFGFHTQTQEGGYVERAGYVDINGTVVIEPIFCYTTLFSQGYATVKLSETEWAYIDRTGTIIYRGFADAEPFSQGYAAVKLSETEWAYIDRTGTIVYRGFADVEPFSEGLAAVSPDKEKYGYISLDGEYVIEPIYMVAFSFSEGLAAVAPMTDDAENRKFGYIDTSGEYVLDPIYGSAGEFCGGVAGVTFGGTRDIEYHLISMSGKEVLKDIFDSVYPVTEGVFQAKKMGERESYFMSVTGEKILIDFSPDIF